MGMGVGATNHVRGRMGMKCKFNAHITCKEPGQHCKTCRIFLEVGQQTFSEPPKKIIGEKKAKGHTTVYYEVTKKHGNA